MGRFIQFLAELSNAEKKQGQLSWDSTYQADADGGVSLNYHDTAINHSTKPTKHLPKQDLENLYKYVHDDAPPRGAIAKSLDKLVSVSSPLNRSILSYRGVRLPSSTVVDIQKAVEAGQYVFSSEWPSSWSNNQSVAWDFVKPKGYRFDANDTSLSSVVFEVLIPAGTKIGRLQLAFGVGAEHVLPSNAKIRLTKIRKYRTGVIFSGKVLP